MMLGRSSSLLLGHFCSLSDPHMATELASPAGNSSNSIHRMSKPVAGELSSAFRSGHWQRKLVAPLIRNEEVNHSILKWHSSRMTCSRKNWLLLAHTTDGSCVEEGGEGGHSGADSNSTGIYYQKMLEANPANPLLLRNYAKFLHEVKHDIDKAEEYYGRAILASPGDGEILSHYAQFKCETHRDASRAEVYFDRAVEAASEDCYVLASYAHFLWNSEEDEMENNLTVDHNLPSPTFFNSVINDAAT